MRKCGDAMSLFEKSDAKTSLQKGIGCADRLYGGILLLCNGRPMVAPTVVWVDCLCGKNSVFALVDSDASHRPTGSTTGFALRSE